MFGFGVPELLIVGTIVMLIFGVGRLPELGASVGEAIGGFRKAVDGKDHVALNPQKDLNA